MTNKGILKTILYFRTWVAISYGVLLSCLHTIISVVVMDSELKLLTQWQQVAANIIILVSVNLVGIFIHNLTEEGQRRAFLDTRDCIAARLEMEDENEKLVSTFFCFFSSNKYSFLLCNIQPNFTYFKMVSLRLSG